LPLLVILHSVACATSLDLIVDYSLARGTRHELLMTTSGRCLLRIRHEVAVFFLSTCSVALRWSWVILSLFVGLSSATITHMLVANALRAVLTFVSRVGPSLSTSNLLKISEGNHNDCNIIQ